MDKKSIAIVILLALLGFGAGYAFINRPHPISAPGVAQDQVYEENEPYYTIKAVYPGGAPKEVEEAVMGTVTQFKEDSNLDHLTPEDIAFQGLGPNRKYSLDISYEKYSSTSTISYVFSIYQDTLGAHPNTFYRTFTFDLEGNAVTLESLFAPESRYLDRLSTLAYGKVTQELKARALEPTPEMLDAARAGTAPSPEALQFFYIEGETLHLLFPPYQVAAYAAGSFDVAIPLGELKDILRQESKHG